MNSNHREDRHQDAHCHRAGRQEPQGKQGTPDFSPEGSGEASSPCSKGASA